MAVQFTLANPCCIRVIPYENNDTQTLTVCLYVDANGNGVPHHVENGAKEMFANCEIKYVDLQRRRLSEIVTRLPSCERKKGKEIFDLSRKIEDNLHVFENRLNVTAVCASYKVTGAVEKEIPCVTVFVLGKGTIPAKETNIQKIQEDHGHLFDKAEFDVVEGYYRPAYGSSPQMEYAFPLRGGVGIGVKGRPGAGTLGGFLEDEDGECYILSNYHVLNPPKYSTLSSNDGPSGVVDDAGTSAGLKEDVDNPNDGANGVLYSAGIFAEFREDESRLVPQTIEQPAKYDYDKMHKKADEDLQNIKDEYSDVANLSQAEKDDLKKSSDEYRKRRLKEYEKKNSTAQQKLQEIEEGAPREIAKYVGGLKGNVELNCDNETYSFYVDAAIAKLDKKELEYITRETADNKTNRCPLYGFNKINDVVPTGEIVDLNTFVKEIREDPDKETKEKLTFLKIGRTTGTTNDGQIDTRFPKLYVKHAPSVKLLTSKMAHIAKKYCINCIPPDVSKAELVKCDKKECSRCRLKSEVYLSWMHNCFTIRQLEQSFSLKGDSGSLIFDNRGRAWGLIHAGWFVSNDYPFTLASPLTVVLNELEKKCGKKLKFW